MLAIGRHLRDRGHRVLFNTAEVFREQVESAGLWFSPLSGKANIDYRNREEVFPDRSNHELGSARFLYDLKHLFGDAIPDQYWEMKRLIVEHDIDVVLADTTFFGTFPLLLGHDDDRPPVVGCGILPLLLSSIDVSPFSGPDSSVEGREQNRHDTLQHQEMLGEVDCYINQILERCGSPGLPQFFLDCAYTLPDLFLQFSADGIEFPRSDMPANVKLVGPVLPDRDLHFEPPRWWGELNKSKPIVLVAQSAVENTDLAELIEPSLSGLACEDVTVVATLDRPGSEIPSVSVPKNARMVPFIPFDRILPKVDALVTNGSFEVVNQALSAGVPVIVSGTSGDKPFVAARVAWSGAGLNIENGRPTPDQIRIAVCNLLSKDTFRKRARDLQKNFSLYHAIDEVTRRVEALALRHLLNVSVD
jgi:UDP:flavonoid glycosyltransferase YjiC (YdhE family)